MQARTGGDVVVGISEREIDAQLRELAQHGVREPGRFRRDAANELDALIDGRMRILLQEIKLVGADAQRVANFGLQACGVAHHAVDELVEGAFARNDAEDEPRCERAVGGAQAGIIEMGFEHIAGECIALPDLRAERERDPARRAHIAFGLRVTVPVMRHGAHSR